MNDLSLRLPAAQLRRRSPAYQWLWANHDWVAAQMQGRIKQPKGGPPIWTMLQDLSGGISRHALRQQWPKVDLAWQDAPPELQTALSSPPPLSTPLRASAASDRNFFGSGHRAIDTELTHDIELPDLAGKTS